MAGQNERWFKAWVIPEDHWLRVDMKYLGAWYDLIGLAEWREGVKVKRGNMFDTQRGVVYMSVNELAERWGWTWRTVKRFVSMLEKDGMVQSIEQNGEQNVFLNNYAKYQDTLQNTKQNTEQSTEQNREQNTEQNTRQNKRQFLPNKEEDKEYKEHKKSVCRTFVPPTISDIVAYAHEAGLKVDADRFWNYYQSNGWMVGRNPMKDWRAAARTWAAKDKADARNKAAPDPKRFNNFEPRQGESAMDIYIRQLEDANG